MAIDKLLEKWLRNNRLLSQIILAADETEQYLTVALHLNLIRFAEFKSDDANERTLAIYDLTRDGFAALHPETEDTPAILTDFQLSALRRVSDATVVTAGMPSAVKQAYLDLEDLGFVSLSDDLTEYSITEDGRQELRRVSVLPAIIINEMEENLAREMDANRAADELIAVLRRELQATLRVIRGAYAALENYSGEEFSVRVVRAKEILEPYTEPKDIE